MVNKEIDLLFELRVDRILLPKQDMPQVRPVHPRSLKYQRHHQRAHVVRLES